MSPPGVCYREAVLAFKKKFLVEMLAVHGGNRTRTARALGLQRTYLLRLIRELRLEAPAGSPRGRSGAASMARSRPCVTGSRSSMSR